MSNSIGSGLAGDVKIIIDHLPYSELTTNNLRKVHWTVRSQVEKIARAEAYYLGLQLGQKKPIERASCHILFHMKDRRVRDLDGLLTGCKAWLDGLTVPKTGRGGIILCGAGIILDDDCWHLHPIIVDVVLDGEEKTEITIREVTGDD